MPNLHPKLSLSEHFQDLPDPRINRTKDHDPIDILVIAVCTVLCADASQERCGQEDNGAV